MLDRNNFQILDPFGNSTGVIKLTEVYARRPNGQHPHLSTSSADRTISPKSNLIFCVNNYHRSNMLPPLDTTFTKLQIFG